MYKADDCSTIQTVIDVLLIIRMKKDTTGSVHDNNFVVMSYLQILTCS